LISRSGALDRTEEQISALTSAALAALEAAEIEAESKSVLRALADAATRRAG
jgi:geranylgeranyl diphosphate synthase type I